MLKKIRGQNGQTGGDHRWATGAQTTTGYDSVLTHNTTTKWPLSSADEMVFEKLFRVKLRSDITAANESESKLPLGQLQTCWLVPLFFHLCQTRTVKTLVSVKYAFTKTFHSVTLLFM